MASREVGVEGVLRWARDALDTMIVDGKPPTVVGHAETPDGLVHVDFAIGTGISKLDIAPMAVVLEPGYLATLVQGVIAEAHDEAKAKAAAMIQVIDEQFDELRKLDKKLAAQLVGAPSSRGHRRAYTDVRVLVRGSCDLCKRGPKRGAEPL